MDDVEMFLGIPYGADTSGAGRFQPPRPAERWPGILEGTQRGDMSPQLGPFIYDQVIGPYFTGNQQQELINENIGMSEDCLVLNVLTPSSSSARRPVIVYPHGGGYQQGSGNPKVLPPGSGGTLVNLPRTRSTPDAGGTAAVLHRSPADTGKPEPSQRHQRMMPQSTPPQAETPVVLLRR